jgi:hypothetical protein
MNMPYTPTGIQPIPHLMPPAPPSPYARFRAWWYRPSRDELRAAQARVAELIAAVERADREMLALADERDQLQEIASKWDQLVDTAEEFDEERGDLQARHLALRTDHIRVLAENQTQAATIKRLEDLYAEMAQQREAAYAEAARWEAAYNEGVAPFKALTAEPVGADVVDLRAWREAAAAVPVEEFHTGMTGAWNKNELRAIVESVTA